MNNSVRIRNLQFTTTVCYTADHLEEVKQSIENKYGPSGWIEDSIGVLVSTNKAYLKAYGEHQQGMQAAYNSLNYKGD